MNCFSSHKYNNPIIVLFFCLKTVLIKKYSNRISWRFTKNHFSLLVYKHSEHPSYLLVCNSYITIRWMVSSFKSCSKSQEVLSFKETFIRVKCSKTYLFKKSEHETFLY